MKKRGWVFLTALLLASGLEARTCTVTTLADSGPGSLREMMANAQSGDFIVFDPTLSGTIALLSPLPPVGVESLMITGPSDLSISIDGGSAFRLFEVQAGPLTLSCLNLLNGASSDQGGALYVAPESYASVSQVSVTPSSGSAGTNPFYVDSDAVLNLSDVTFTSGEVSQIFLHSGNVNVTNAISSSYVIDGDEDASFSKYGLGELVLSSVSVPSVSLSVFEGGVEYEGGVYQSCVIYPQAAFLGNFTAAGFTNLGTLQVGPSDAFGTLVCDGDFYALDAITQIRVDPLGNSDQIQVNGHAFLNGGILQLIPSAGTYSSVTTYSLCLTSTGGINGVFGAVSAEGFEVQVEYFPTFLRIQLLAD